MKITRHDEVPEVEEDQLALAMPADVPQEQAVRMCVRVGRLMGALVHRSPLGEIAYIERGTFNGQPAMFLCTGVEDREADKMRMEPIAMLLTSEDIGRMTLDRFSRDVN
jgi:hypothetical protein